ncbi:hypothetical protein D7V86_18590 [bacterium D16-51]|nr:hypothetical protein D7V96_14390 [bacterium D16-59]RKI56977.1 hypothetical protein D7V86_18590 [bacterium D16-51]
MQNIEGIAEMKVRDVFFLDVYDKAKSGEDIIIASSDIGAPSLDEFRIMFGNRFVNVGIAEQNLLAVSAGLAFAGKKVIAYGLNPFPVTRAFDQIRNFMASMQLPITLTALNAGTCSAEAGYTHMPVENVSIMRTLQNIKVINPSDETISHMLVNEILSHPSPRYIQFDKYIEGKQYEKCDIDFSRGFVVNRNDDKQNVVIITYGIWVRECLKAGLDCDIIDCFSLPVNEEILIGELRKYENIVTVEDGILVGGLGSMILEIINKYGMNNKIISYGLCMKDGYPKTYTNREVIWNQSGIKIDALNRLIGHFSRSSDNE